MSIERHESPLQEQWVIIHPTQSPTSGDLSPENAEKEDEDTPDVPIEYGIEVDVEREQKVLHGPSQFQRSLRWRDICICAYITLFIVIIVIVATGSIYGLEKLAKNYAVT